jgi:predicted Zn-dependent protease
LLGNLGRTKEALGENEKALELDPASPQINANHASLFTEMHRYDEAMAEFNKLIAREPEFPQYYDFRSLLYWRLGNLDAYVADSVMAMRKSGRQDVAKAFASGYQTGKLKGACLAIIEVMKNKSKKGYESPYQMALYHALMGDRDHTFEWLEKAYAERSGGMEYLKVEVFFESFHSDPRFIDLLKRMGFPQ